jgi:hypothetical protein
VGRGELRNAGGSEAKQEGVGEMNEKEGMKEEEAD